MCELSVQIVCVELCVPCFGIVGTGIRTEVDDLVNNTFCMVYTVWETMNEPENWGVGCGVR